MESPDGRRRSSQRREAGGEADGEEEEEEAPPPDSPPFFLLYPGRGGGAATATAAPGAQPQSAWRAAPPGPRGAPLPVLLSYIGPEPAQPRAGAARE